MHQRLHPSSICTGLRVGHTDVATTCHVLSRHKRGVLLLKHLARIWSSTLPGASRQKSRRSPARFYRSFVPQAQGTDSSCSGSRQFLLSALYYRFTGNAQPHTRRLHRCGGKTSKWYSSQKWRQSNSCSETSTPRNSSEYSKPRGGFKQLRAKLGLSW